MFQMLVSNLEIKNFLTQFEIHHWRRAVKSLCIIGLRKVKEFKETVSVLELEQLADPGEELSSTLRSMKEELKCLESSVKRIEQTGWKRENDCGEGFRSALNAYATVDGDDRDWREVNDEIAGFSTENGGMSKEKSRNGLKNFRSNSFSSRFWGEGGRIFEIERERKGKHFLKEPKVCDINEAKRMISFLNPRKSNRFRVQ